MILLATLALATERNDHADFIPGDTSVTFRLGTTGAHWGPWTIATSVIGWTEAGIAFEKGISGEGGRTIGVGAEFWGAQGFLASAVSRGELFDSEAEAITWTGLESGAAGRLTAHFVEFSSLDAYALLLAGPTYHSLQFKRTTGIDATGGFQAVGARTAAGLGVRTVTRDDILLGIELRYVVGVRFRRGPIVLSSEGGASLGTVELRAFNRSPRGFSWMFQFGKRF